MTNTIKKTYIQFTYHSESRGSLSYSAPEEVSSQRKIPKDLPEKAIGFRFFDQETNSKGKRVGNPMAVQEIIIGSLTTRGGPDPFYVGDIIQMGGTLDERKRINTGSRGDGYIHYLGRKQRYMTPKDYAHKKGHGMER
jgi:hypothetical protein